MGPKTLELVRRLIDDEPPDDALKGLYRHYGAALRNFFRKRGFSIEDSEDLMQETFIGVYQSRSGLRDPNRFEPWMYRIATNVWYNRLRHRKAEKRSASTVPLAAFDRDEALPLPDDRPDPAVRLIADEQWSRIRDAIEELPTKMRACLRLRLEGFGYREIAELSGVSVNTVKSHVHQATERLKHQLARVGAGGEP